MLDTYRNSIMYIRTHKIMTHITLCTYQTFAPPPPMQAREGNRRGFDLQRNLYMSTRVGQNHFSNPLLPHPSLTTNSINSNKVIQMPLPLGCNFSLFSWLSPSFSAWGEVGQNFDRCITATYVLTMLQ